MTPEDIRLEIVGVIRKAQRAPDAIRDLEVKAESDALKFDTEFAKALLSATGNVEERKAAALLATEEFKNAANVSKAELNRGKLLTKQLSEQQMGLQSVLKSIQAEGA
jgi:hypothetical protein